MRGTGAAAAGWLGTQPEDSMPKLARFEISATPEGFALHIADDGGRVLDLDVSPEQLDALIDALDALLSDEDDTLAADNDDEEAPDGTPSPRLM